MNAVHLFTSPAESCWAQIKIHTFTQEAESTVTKVALLSLNLIGLIFTLPIYFVGKSFEILISPFYSEPPYTESVSAKNHPKTKELIHLSSFPIWKNFSKLSFASQYLVAGRYYYNNWGWSLESKFQILAKFESEFKSRGNLHRARRAINEAIVISKKIQLLITFQNSSTEDRRRMLASIDRATLTQIQYFIGRKNENSSKNSAIASGRKILQETPNSRIIDDAIDNLIYHLNKAYPQDSY